MSIWAPILGSIAAGLLGGGGASGKQQQTTSIPPWLEDAIRANMAQAQQVGQLGYVPYYGPDVAAMTPMQTAAGSGIGSAAAAFGMPGGDMTGMQGMPQPQTFAGGMRGYSSGPMFNQSLNQLRQQRPGQYGGIMGMFMNPRTGQMPKARGK